MNFKLTLERDYNVFNCLPSAVSELQCSFASQGGSRDQISARLRKPGGFRGSPLFADDRRVDPATDPYCQIRLDPSDPTDMTYNMLVNDFSRCGVVKRNVSIKSICFPFIFFYNIRIHS